MLSSFRLSARDVVTPVTIIAFAVSTVTGAMLLLHWNGGLVRFSHEWLSLGFSLVALWHLARNWRPFLAYLKRSPSRAVFLTAIVASLAFTGLTGNPAPVNTGAVFRALSHAPLGSAASAFGITSDEAVARLRTAKIEAAEGETVSVIGARAGVAPARVLTVLATERGQ